MEFLHIVLTGNLFLRLSAAIDLTILYHDFGILSFLKAMIIIAWNGSGQPSAIFEVDVFKKVLSIFITAAILKLAQGIVATLCLKSFL